MMEMDAAGGDLIGRLVSWTEKPRYGGKETTWRARIAAIEGRLARLELISPSTGRAYAPVSELIDAETGTPLALPRLDERTATPPPLPPPHTPESGAGTRPAWKPRPIDPEDLRRRLGLPDEPVPEPRFHVPTTPAVSPSKPRNDRDDDDIAQARRWLSSWAPAIEGQGGRPHTYKTVCIVMFGWELSEHDTLMLVGEWNVLCRPPWKPSELAEMVKHAAKRGSRYPTGFMKRGRRPRKPRKPRKPRERPDRTFGPVILDDGPDDEGAAR